MSEIRLYNTMTRRKEAIRTERPDRVTMYVCGPTVYNYAHIGNARPAVVFDVLARLLRALYNEVIYARNFTDVDDKINAAAEEKGVPIAAITERYIDAYQRDMRALGVAAPNIEPRVTEAISTIVALIKTLIARGNAYVAEDHVLFHVPSFPEYGALSRRKPDEMMAGARVEVAPYKKSPLDFVLWKPSTPAQPGWESPWGRGRPGWHIECTAMIERHLGRTIDIHGGGQDLIFPHHENEIAQGTCAHDGELYCNTWVHNSFVTVDGRKMSKSLGNVLLARELLEQAPGEVIRLALLSTRYRQPLDWNQQRLATACRLLGRLYASLARAEQVAPDADAPADADVMQALCDDLNTSQALARLSELGQALEAALEGDDANEQRRAKGALLASAALLGLLEQPPREALSALAAHARPVTLSVPRIEALVETRDQARRARDFARADALRDELAEAGVALNDTAAGTAWAPIDAWVSVP